MLNRANSKFMTKTATCRYCEEPLNHLMCDLGMSPMANSYPKAEQLSEGERAYPLKVWVCEKCLLAQLEEFETPESIFSDYAYFSSVSSGWVEHARRYASMMINRFGFDENTIVVEVASNDGYLLQHFSDKGIPVLGIEPAANIALHAKEEKGIETIVRFFGSQTARMLHADGRGADLLIGNNVLAHVPDIKDFVRGVKIALNPRGIFTFEFPHLMRLIDGNQYDTIYHEHFSYLSLLSVERIFARYGLELFDVEELPTHGGSLRIFGKHAGYDSELHRPTGRVADLREREIAFGLAEMGTYHAFAERSKAAKRDLLTFLIDVNERGESVVCYGAAAKGVTLMNFCGLGSDMIDYVVDKSPYKQGRYIPGSSVAIHPPSKIFETRPDYVMILPWNISDEVRSEMSGIREWGGRFVVPIPNVRVLE
jgi:SAM-dependent methyltransferase